MRGILRDTFNELIDRKFIWIFILVVLFVAVMIWGTSKSQVYVVQNQMGGLETVEQGDSMTQGMEVHAFGAFVSFLVFLSVMASAGLIPNMMQKGRADFYLSQPLSRSRLYLTKLGSIWIVYGGLILAASLIVMIFGSIFLGSWRFSDLIIVGIFLVDLFIWLIIIGFAGILSNSTSISIMTAFGVWVIQKILTGHEAIEMFFSSDVIKGIIRWLYYIFPKSSQVGDIAIKASTGSFIDSYMPLWSSLLAAAIIMTLTITMFKKKNY